MPRALKVSREQAVKSAMNVFWEQGYKTTTVDDLQKAMGLQRGSFYFHFKDKRSLFIEVLDYYKQSVVEKRRSAVRACPSARSGIDHYFKLLLEHLTNNQANAGCLNTNSVTELGFSDGEIAEKLASGLRGWKEFWMEILKKAQAQNELPEGINLNAAAQHIVAMTQGLNVVARVNPDANFLRGIVSAGLAGLNK